MKSTKLIIILLTFLSSSLMSVKTSATLPPWASADGYHKKTTHLFLPEQNMYYDLKNDVYWYDNNGQWEKSSNIPEKYIHVDLKNVKQVELALNSDEPYLDNIKHRGEYNKGVKQEQEQYVKKQKEVLKATEKKQKELKKEQDTADRKQKELEKAEKKAERERKTAEKKQKQIEEAQVKADKAQRKAEEEATKAQQRIDKANKKAEEAQAKAAKEAEKAQKDAVNAQKDAEKAQKKADKIFEKNN